MPLAHISDAIISVMKYLVWLLFIYAYIVAAPFGSFKSVVFAASQAEGSFPQVKNLCGGTNGNGEIVSIGSNVFTLKLNDGGEKGGGSLIVSLTSRTTIETPTGFVSLSGLKTGDRVTLVGDNHHDGTFTADAVVVCGGTKILGTQEIGTGQATPIIMRNNVGNNKIVSGVIDAVAISLVGLIWLGLSLFLKLKKRRSYTYLLFFTIFYIYLYKVLDYTLLQFQSLLLLQHFLPNLRLNGVEAGRVVNIIPLATLTMEDVKTSLLNIIMMIPFGFGLPFITDFRFKKVVITGILLSIAIEFLQLMTGFMANTTFRIADINDLIFNTLGVAIGYILFVGFMLIFHQVFRNRKLSANPILRYIAEIHFGDR